MIAAIAEVLKYRLSNLPWIERFGGLVNQATRPVFVQGADGVQVVTGYQTYPVACDVNDAKCWENGVYKHFEPDSRKGSIAFFVDNGGVTLRSVEGPNAAGLKFNFDLKFLCWMNLNRLGTTITDASMRVVPYIMAQFYGTHSASGIFDGGIEETIFQAIEVTGIRQLQKTPAMFQPFTFATDGERRALFLYPYDYFGLQITGTFIINKNCLPDLYAGDYDFVTGPCLPGSGTPGGGWNPGGCAAQNILSCLPEYVDDAAAIAAGLDEGKFYVVLPGNDAIPAYTVRKLPTT
jgi:hypothetical protein